LLDCFSYNGGFALHLARDCATAEAIDISGDAVERIRQNALRNGLSNVEAREANVFDELRRLEKAGERYDTIVLDPPAFAKNKASIRMRWPDTRRSICERCVCSRRAAT
jgi:23S rRNA (cytosine1962-C5)-methyltransferase